jgi:hypothetical protein
MKKIILFILNLLFVSFINAQDAKWAKELHNIFLIEGKNYYHPKNGNFEYGGDKKYFYKGGSYTPDEYATIKLKEETGKFPNYTKINSLKEDVSKLWNEYSNPISSKQGLDFFEKNYNEIVGYYNELLELDKYNLKWYNELVDFHIYISLAGIDESTLKQKQLTKNEKYLEPLNSLFKTMKINFTQFNDAVYTRITGCFYNLGKYQESYDNYIEFKGIKGENFDINENIEKNLNSCLILCLLEYKLGLTDKYLNQLNEIKSILLSKKIELNKFPNFMKLLELGSYDLYGASPFHPTYFSSPNNQFKAKKIDFEKIVDLVPINNFSSRILFSTVHNQLSSGIDNCFDSYLKGYTNGGVYFISTDYLWPSFSPLTIENTPNLINYLNQEKYIALLLTNRYIDNIIHFENLGGVTKVFFMANKEHKVIGVFDLPKNSEGFNKIMVNYYTFNHTFHQNQYIKIEIPHEILGDSRYRHSKTFFHFNYETIKTISYSRVESSMLTELNLPLSISCEKIVQLKLKEEKEQLEKEKIRLAEEQRQEQLRLDEEIKKNQSATNNTANSNNTNTSQGQSTQCNFVFKKPQLNITYVDNRKMCCYCNKRYAQYSTRNGASTEAIAYIGEELYLHFQKTNADKAHQDADIQRFQKFVAENYDLLSSMGVAFAVSRAQILEMTGNALCSKNRKVDKYSVDSKFCSAECQDKCSWSENCKCR